MWAKELVLLPIFILQIATAPQSCLEGKQMGFYVVDGYSSIISLVVHTGLPTHKQVYSAYDFQETTIEQ